ncbi:MAG: FAD:protein FMN transferase [Gammaproteobacteria bacterium]|nr:MAG: FAD:protein FMN transferase [Gammaproteobacteria bacterium]
MYSRTGPGVRHKHQLRPVCVHRVSNLRLARIGLFLVAFALSGCERRLHLVEQHLLEFGTLIEITLIADDLSHAESLLGEIENRLRRYRNQWHAWEDSDLTRFNAELRQSGQAQVPASLRPLLNLCFEYYRASDGLFNPALGKLIAAHGFHAAEPDAAAIAAIKSDLPTLQDLRVENDFAISRNPNLQLDLGGIAKGYAIGLIADYLEANGVENYIVNAGGDMKIAGNRFGRPWRLGIQNPFALRPGSSPASTSKAAIACLHRATIIGSTAMAANDATTLSIRAAGNRRAGKAPRPC